MFQVSREFNFCYGHRLLDHQGKCKHLHGHNARVVVAFEAADLDCQGMVLDFNEIKQIVNRWVEDNLDHRMILRRDDPAVEPLEKLGEPLYLIENNPTAENIAQLIFERAAEAGLPMVEVRLWETPNCHATYRVS
ncbi:MAG: 6-carboxytetrahydropterin synthase [Planctomycetota bacterium]|nr:6-carboxytetrahydropterin synthase [Planctomycetota bacterium]